MGFFSKKKIAVLVACVFTYWIACYTSERILISKIHSKGFDNIENSFPLIGLNGIYIRNIKASSNLQKFKAKDVTISPFSKNAVISDLEFDIDYFSVNGKLKSDKEEVNPKSNRSIVVNNFNGKIRRAKDELFIVNGKYNNGYLFAEELLYKGIQAKNVSYRDSELDIDSLSIILEKRYHNNIKKTVKDKVNINLRMRLADVKEFISKFKTVRINSVTGVLQAGAVEASYVNESIKLNAQSFKFIRNGYGIVSGPVSVEYFDTNLLNLNSSLENPQLLVGGKEFELRKLNSNLRFDLQPSKIHLYSSTISINDIINLDISFLFNKDSSELVNLSVIMNSVSCHDFLSVFPPFVKSKFSELTVLGNIKAALVDGKSNIENTCKFNGPSIIPSKANFSGYRYNRDFTPLFYVSEYVPKALLVSEDGRFYSHKGIDLKAIKSALQDYFKSGELRGASTITMQLAKNLWLTKDRKIERKIEEALLSLYLESKLGKDSIMELYLNIIELGPKVYGIFNGAQYYFNKAPIELTVKESLFLMSILPQPTVNYFTNNLLNESRNQKLNYLLLEMKNRGLISEQEYQSSIYESIIKRN